LSLVGGRGEAAEGEQLENGGLGLKPLQNGGVDVAASSAMKDRPPSVGGDGQQAPLPPVERGLRYHQLNEFQWRREGTGVYDGSDAILVLVEVLIGHFTLCEGLDMG